MAKTVKVPAHMKRAAVLGEDVLFYVNADRRSDPRIAKVVEVGGMNPSTVKLHFYGSIGLGPSDVYHIDDPLLTQHPSYAEMGAWDFHPVMSRLIDAALDVPPAPKQSQKPQDSAPAS